MLLPLQIFHGIPIGSAPQKESYRVEIHSKYKSGFDSPLCHKVRLTQSITYTQAHIYLKFLDKRQKESGMCRYRQKNCTF